MSTIDTAHFSRMNSIFNRDVEMNQQTNKIHKAQELNTFLKW